MALIERGRSEAAISDEFPVSTLVEAFLALMACASARGGRPEWVPEDISSMALSLFLGAARPASGQT